MDKQANNAIKNLAREDIFNKESNEKTGGQEEDKGDDKIDLAEKMLKMQIRCENMVKMKETQIRNLAIKELKMQMEAKLNNIKEKDLSVLRRLENHVVPQFEVPDSFYEPQSSALLIKIYDQDLNAKEDKEEENHIDDL